MNEDQGQRPVRVAMVTNIPAPYRLPVYERLVAQPGIELCVFFCSGREPDREWDLQGGGFQQVFLSEKFITYRGRYIHCNPDAWSALKRFAPDVVITTGFNPTFLVAYAFARWHGLRHIPMTDGTLVSESATLSGVHRFIRRVVYRGSQAFIGASEGSLALYRSYDVGGGQGQALFQSHLCANNVAYAPRPWSEKTFDFVFSARFVALKQPLFAMDVAQQVARRLGRPVRLLLLGSGPLQAEMQARADGMRGEVDVVFAGFVKQAALPGHYASAKLLLFPTTFDPWGVVANEACAAGLPVLVSDVAGVAGDLVVDGVNGRVLPLEQDAWVDAAVALLSDPALYARQAAASVERVARFDYGHAAQGIRDAVWWAMGRR
ncbi:glycosyltransferase family 4 protein [Aquabacterium sp.]|uniref:glycosyltransferase family 4 protein n=1 Tax=Aquabacterium sp. TaxID=1872578 RepID=UPI0025C5C263|nr:glycosyltransferase family 4 protein [Aquabacterium sp.]